MRFVVKNPCGRFRVLQRLHADSTCFEQLFSCFGEKQLRDWIEAHNSEFKHDVLIVEVHEFHHIPW